MKWANPTGDSQISTFLHKLENEFYNLDYLPAAAMRTMKCRLEELKDTISPKHQKFVNAVLHNITRQLEIRFECYGRHDHRKHRMSDHAFVRTLELLHGLDIDELKDKAIEDVENSASFRPLYKDKRIVTILPREAEDEKAPEEQNCQRPAHAEVQNARRAG